MKSKQNSPDLTTTEEITNVRGLRLASICYKPGKGTQTALCLHGWLDNAASFETLAPLLPVNEVHCLELSGHGHSDHKPPSAFDYSLIDWALEAAHVVCQKDWKDLMIVGHSMGASIGLILASLLPDRVRRLVLLDGGLPLVDPAEGVVPRMRNALENSLQLEKSANQSYRSFETLVAARLRYGGLEQKTAATLLRRGAACMDSGAWVVLSDPRLKGVSPVRMVQDQVLTIIKSVECPVDFVACSDLVSITRTNEQFQDCLEAFPRLRKIDLPGNHYVHFERANEVVESVFL